MINYVCVLPYAFKPYYNKFIRGCKLENILEIDNTIDNIGIMKSHNKGIEFMREKGADWLITLSACLRFGKAGGLDFIEQLEQNQDTLMAHASGRWTAGDGTEHQNIALGWHFTAFNKKIFDEVGGWDTNFSPYGLDDVDLTMRIQKHFGKDYKLIVLPCDFKHESTSHSISLAKVKSAFNPRHSYFMRKWGKDCHEWQQEGYMTPFNLDKPLSYYPDENDLHSIWKNEFLSGGYNYND